MNFQSFAESPNDLPAEKPFDGVAEDGPQFLELRTESGSVYVRPSRWQRFRLLWTFRHFHVLPRQVLSCGDQHLIEGLSQSAVVSMPLPAASSIIGVVEMARSSRTAAVRPQGASLQAFQGKPLVPPAKPSVKEFGPVLIKPAAEVQEESARRDGRFQQWRALGGLAAVGLVVILARFYGVSPAPQTAPHREAPVAFQPVRPVVATVAPTPAAPPPIVQKPTRRVVAPTTVATVAPKPAPPAIASEPAVTASSAPVAAMLAAMAPSPAAERLFVSQLPQGRFARPVLSDPDLVGEVELKALIGADGSVEEVSLVKGNPKLAQAGSRAVRHWHYSPEQGLGREAEALIRMSFFGPDAISVTSLAR